MEKYRPITLDDVVSHKDITTTSESTLLSLFPSCFSSSRADGAQSRSLLMPADYPIFCYTVHLVSYPPYRPPFPDQTRSIGESAAKVLN